MDCGPFKNFDNTLSVNSNVTWYVPDKDIVGKYIVNVEHGGCFGENGLDCAWSVFLISLINFSLFLGWGKRWRLGETAGVEVDLVQEHVLGLDPALLADSKIIYNM